MITKQIELRHIELPMRKPFTTSFGTVKSRHLVVGKFTTDAGETYAETAPLHSPVYSPETITTVMHMITDYIGPLMIAVDIRDPEDLYNKTRWIRGNNMAKHLADTAVYHLLSQTEGVPLYRYLGGTRKEIEAGISIGILNTHELLNTVGEKLDEGFKRIKIKIQPSWDIEPVRAIRDKYGDIPLVADANSAYTLGDIETFKTLDGYDLMMIEQPLAEDDIIDHATLQNRIKTPICLDESIESVEDARKAIQISACRIINIKPGRVGGLYQAKRIHDVSYESQVPVWVGGMFESAIGKLDNIAIATLAGFSMPGDIGRSEWYFTDDLIVPSFEVNHGMITPPENPGIGFEVDRRRLDKYTINKVMIT